MGGFKQKFLVTLKFTGGVLEGLTYTITRENPVAVGTKIERSFISPSPYEIISCEPICVWEDK